MSAGAVSLQDVARVRAMMDSDWAMAWKPRADMPLSVWAEEHRHISGKTGATSGRWRNDRAPYLSEVMDSLTAPGVHRVTVMKCAQSGGTETWINWLLWSIDLDPVPILVVFPNKDLAVEANKDRLLEEVRATPTTADKVSSRAWDVKGTSVRFQRMRLRLAGSNSDANLSSWPECRLIMDEFDKYPDPKGVASKAESRTITFKRARIMALSTPTDDDFGIAVRFREGDQRRWWVPCPQCGAFQVLHFAVDMQSAGGVRWANGLDADPTEVERTAWYECEFCAAAITEGRKGWMNRRGLWLPAGRVPEERLPVDDPETVRRAALPHRHESRWTPAVRGHAPETNHHSYHIHGCMSPFLTWGKIARQFVENSGEPERAWVNEKLGEPWRRPGVSADADVILGYAQEVIPGEVQYLRGNVPPGALVLSMHMDVQLDSVFYEVVAWGEKRSRWLIDYGVVYCPQDTANERDVVIRLPPGLRESPDLVAGIRDDPWMLVERQCRAEYPRMDTGEVERIRSWGIDMRFRKKEVLDFVRRLGPGAMATYGGGGAQMLAPHALKTDEETGAVALAVNTFLWKNEAFARMHRRPPSAGAWRWPADLTKYYAAQVTSEELVEEDTAAGKKRVWEKRERHAQNHWWDCLYSGYALADYNGLDMLTMAEAARVKEREREAAARQRKKG